MAGPADTEGRFTPSPYSESGEEARIADLESAIAVEINLAELVFQSMYPAAAQYSR